ncbi:unannotated protein [freshwater metagenome]|uniref:Unannotated protein n=1 Tax=freshwater metagenome TaxID=449393 RepID=A0A6J7DY64_9ZZZZ|nr:DUF4386 family protein [Actinomycetota bacterium]
MTTGALTTSPSETLAWEAENRSRASVAAWLAAIMTLAGALLTSIAFNSMPKYEDRTVTIIDGLRDLAAGQPLPAGRAVLQLQFIGDHPLRFIPGPLLSALGALLLYFALAYLFRAARARSGALSQGVLISLATGAVTYAIGTMVIGIMRVVEGANLAANATNSDALDALQGGPMIVGTIIQLVGSFILGFALVMISLNAMRTGLLPRFIGIIGMLAGATFVLPLDQQGIIRAFWIGAIGFLIAGRWPSSVPAWQTGKAEPWPSAAETQARKAAAREAAAAGAGATSPPPTDVQLPQQPEQQSTQDQRRKKRKRG